MTKEYQPVTITFMSKKDAGSLLDYAQLIEEVTGGIHPELTRAESVSASMNKLVLVIESSHVTEVCELAASLI